MPTPEKLLSPYDPKQSEAAMYQLWLDNRCFAANANSDKPPFSMVLPPPNVTGVLHVGHGLMLVIQDILARFHRANGYETLWLPGTDHASIATQSKVEKMMSKEGLRRGDLSRENFLDRINAFALESQTTILSQFKSMGASLDWDRLTYTLDDTRVAAVRRAFIDMHKAGLIYQGDRVVNWDPKGQTVISDDEVNHEEAKGTLYTFKYSADFPIAISTTRPETKLGDTAIAVHPDDVRYQQYIGQTFDVKGFADAAELTITVIADREVDPEFGTGALGVTPAHSKTDEAMARANDLPFVAVINEYAKIVDGFGQLSGKKTTVARAEIVTWLETNDLLIESKEVDQNISKAERTGGIIEPLPKLQWWIDVNKEITNLYESNF